MKLKTLNDLFEELPQDGVTYYVLKQEAIKRVKECKRPVDFTRHDRCGHDKKEYCDVCQREIWFNNLIEEDLK